MHEVGSIDHSLRSQDPAHGIAEHATLINLQCEVHGDTVDGVATPQSSMVDYILGHGIDVHHSFASDWG